MRLTYEQLAGRRALLACSECGAVISQEVLVLDHCKGAVLKPEAGATEPIMPRGEAFLSSEPWEYAERGPPPPLQFAPQVWMNLDDLFGFIGRSPHADRLSGCCGLDGCDGPNRVCRCGNHIGTEKSDCWQSLAFIPQPSATHWVAVEVMRDI